ncbi:hypothetical protein EJ06DRAFT_529466 [Trichodelitschia bisporula]|uniref:Uncharacterized protein n=1 Tax=Trichodelitschia bisporula TaxID=703511 RepID=A0A6G1HZ65_9PEZI|nr:hypothetical protein EJ06DRAFT_529466 [Trichodelitschia bisporula]
MSAEADPITSEHFSRALKDLPLSSLYAKASELRNSMAHLQSSNEQLREFAEAGDRDCFEAIQENEEVLQRMEMRILLVRNEVEARGLVWSEHGSGDVTANGASEAKVEGPETTEAATAEGGQSGGHLSDEELRRRLAESMEENGDDGGVHL